jgi:cell division septation protein DedD
MKFRKEHTPMLKIYLFKLAIRVCLFLITACIYIWDKDAIYSLVMTPLGQGINFMHVLWLIFMVMMINHLIPRGMKTMALLKIEKRAYLENPDYDREKLRGFVKTQNKKAAVVMIVCFFAWSVPVSNSVEAGTKQAAIFSAQLFETVEEKPHPVLVPVTTFADEAEEQVVEDVANVEADSVAVSSIVESPKVMEQPVAPARYTLVVCSCVPQKNAEALVAELKASGLEDVDIFVKGDILRVIVGGYPTADAATEALREYRRERSGFEEAWVLRK